MFPVPRDKVLHLIAGAALFALGHHIAGPRLGTALCLGGAAAKELLDCASSGGSPSLADLVATAAGGAVAALALPARHPDLAG